MDAGKLEGRLEIAGVAGELSRVADHAAVGLGDPDTDLLVGQEAGTMDIDERVMHGRGFEGAIAPDCQLGRARGRGRAAAGLDYEEAHSRLPAAIALRRHLVAA